MTIKEIKEKLLAGNVPTELLDELSHDSRSGVQKLLSSYNKRMQKLAETRDAFDQRFTYERRYWEKNKIVAGVDEVGRGPLAGPVVTAAVILDQNFDLIEVNDSKKLTPQKRLTLYPKIFEQAISVAIGVKSAQVIDEINIYEADRLAMAEAVNHLNIKPDALLVDAMVIPVDIPQEKLIKGDAKSNSIAAASIVAKVYRDKLMDDYAELYPAYDFKNNAGYGTAKHLAALKEYGPTPIHRKTFAPVNEFFN